MVELNQKRLHQIEHLVAFFREEKVRTINDDHQSIISVSQRDEIIQEFDPWTAIWWMLETECNAERICKSSGFPSAMEIIPVCKFDTDLSGSFNLCFQKLARCAGSHKVHTVRGRPV